MFGFILTWTPYAVTFFISAFSGNGDSAPPMAIFICSCFAKTSVMWIPLLYCISAFCNIEQCFCVCCFELLIISSNDVII
jgi:hypothetical protein